MRIMRVVSRYFRKGGSYAVIVPPAVRQSLQLAPGDTVLFTLIEDAAVLVRIDHNRLIELDEARKMAARANAA